MNDEIDRGVTWLLFLFVVVGGVMAMPRDSRMGSKSGGHVRRLRVMGLIIMGGMDMASCPSSDFVEPTVTACDEP